jgi:hypothetical protein
MNRYLPLLLMSMILPLQFSAINPFEDAPATQYIELIDMSAPTATRLPLSHDQHPGVPYQSLGESQYQNPGNDLDGARLRRSTMQRRIFSHTLPEQGLLMIMRACFSCCFPPIPPTPPISPSDSL